MDKFWIKAVGPDGNHSELGEIELNFIVLPPSAAKAFCGIGALGRILLNGRFAEAFNVLRGGFNSAIKGTPGLSHGDYAEIIRAIIGFSPVEIACPQFRLDFPIEDDEDLLASIILLHQIIGLNQYAAGKFSIKGKVVVDAGANSGVFSLYAARLGAKRVYSFEPLKSTYKRLVRNVKRNGLGSKIIPVNMALGEKNGVSDIHFSSDGSEVASMIKGRKMDKSEPIRVATIDSFFHGKMKIGFIKMDVEGYEAEILRGAAKTMQKHKPVLSFSAYHKPGDKEELPVLVRKIRGDYSCRLLKRCEEDIYCE